MADKGTKRKLGSPKRAQKSPPKTVLKRQSRERQKPEAGTFQTNIASPAQVAASAAGPRFPIVGVGASAGGLEAFSQLLQSLPSDSGMAIVLIQHLAPRHESALAMLLSGSTPLPVAQATHDMQVKPNHVYVIPPNTQMGIAEGKLQLGPRPEDRTQYTPIDSFFRALAEYAEGSAIGVILSGTASDGAVGLRDIKAAGGITIAQDPETARYDGMPRAAIATSAVDLVLSPKQIAEELVRLSRHPLVRQVVPRQEGDDVGVSDDHLARIFQMLRNATGVDFTHYKQPTIRRRLQRRMVLHKITGIEQYIKYMQQHPEETKDLYQDLLIHVTRFFREPESFQLLMAQAFPKMLEQRHKEEPIRIWVPGCSTGEEVYSIAITLLEFLGDQAGSVPIQIFGTDISDTAIDHARSGIYPETIATDVSAERLRRFFSSTDARYRINKIVRDLCIFARQDLTRDPPFSRLDLIVCRNVLIYLGPVLQKRLMSVFHYALKPNGYLLLGNAETIGPHAELFAVADKRHRLYTRKAGVVHADVDFVPSGHAPARPLPGRKPVEPQAANNVLAEASRLIVARYSPPGVIIDNDLQIVQFRGQTGPYLEPAPGEASLNLLKMAREGLLYGLRTALHEARKTNHSARKEGLRVKYNGSVRHVNLEVVPIAALDAGHHFLILFEDVTSSDEHEAAPTKEPVPAKSKAKREDDRILRLQQELAASREYMQSVIQDLEAANEELQSANEEILSANEELQSTNEELDTAKEELQSTNEELNTVNEELHARNEELSRVNSDLVNLLSSVQIAIVMVASNLRIRRFTPMAEKILNLIPGDIGRPISDIKPNIDCPDLEQLITEAIDSVSIKERHVQDRNGNRFFLRIRPYKNVDNRIDGAVLALFDATDAATARVAEPARE